MTVVVLVVVVVTDDDSCIVMDSELYGMLSSGCDWISVILFRMFFNGPIFSSEICI